ncbi:hypothetical protein [Methylovulum psychrotolerans]|nr:hypothetical protein [Methylovulum psychrotolerans]
MRVILCGFMPSIIMAGCFGQPKGWLATNTQYSYTHLNPPPMP